MPIVRHAEEDLGADAQYCWRWTETEPPAGLHDGIMERLRQEETVRVVAPQSRCAVCRCLR